MSAEDAFLAQAGAGLLSAGTPPDVAYEAVRIAAARIDQARIEAAGEAGGQAQAGRPDPAGTGRVRVASGQAAA